MNPLAAQRQAVNAAISVLRMKKLPRPSEAASIVAGLEGALSTIANADIADAAIKARRR